MSTVKSPSERLIGDCNSLLDSMQKPVKYHLNRKKESPRNVLLLSKFMKRFNKAGDAASVIGEHASEFHAFSTIASMDHSSHIVAVVVAGLDFFRIPLMYVIAYIVGEKMPFKISNALKWLYSALIVSLVTVALAVPVTAPIIAFVLAGLGVALSSVLLVNMLVELIQITRQLRQVKKQLSKEEQEMELIQLEAKQLQDQLKNAKSDEVLSAIYAEIEQLRKRYNAQKASIEILKNKELQLLEQRNSMKAIKAFDRGLGVFLGTVIIAGLIVGIFFPPIGAAIVIAASVTSVTYIAARIVFPLVSFLGKWVMNKINRPAELENPTQQDVLEEHPHAGVINDPNFKSTVFKASEDLDSKKHGEPRFFGHSSGLAPGAHPDTDDSEGEGRKKGQVPGH